MAEVEKSRSPSISLLVLTSSVLSLLLYVIYYRFLHPLARFPGPFFNSLSNGWKLWQSYNDRMPFAIRRLHEQYGSVVRVGPNDLSFNDASAIGDIYKKGWQKGEFYKGFARREPGLFSMRDVQLHAQRRRMFALGFAMPSLRSMEPIIDSRYAVLRQQLDRFARSGEIFDLRRYITYTIADILGELAFGSGLGVQRSEDPAKIPPVGDALWGPCLAGQAPWAVAGFNFVRDHFPSTQVKKTLQGSGFMMPIASKSINERNEKGIQRDDFLARLMTAREEKTGQTLTREQILIEAMTLLTGGTGTTGNTLHLLFANLSRNPQYLKRIVAELDERLPPFQPGQAAYQFQGLTEKLDFTNLAIRENFRKDPIAGFNMPRTVPASGAEIAGHHVPGGTQVFANTHAVHRNPTTWGSDADVYDPDRWYDDRARDLKEFVVPFSVGKRACVGQNLANVNILKMTTMLLKAYEWEWVNVEEQMEVRCHGDLELKTPLFVRCRMRGEPFQG